MRTFKKSDNDSRVVCSEHFDSSAYMCPAWWYIDSRLLNSKISSSGVTSEVHRVPKSTDLKA